MRVAGEHPAPARPGDAARTETMQALMALTSGRADDHMVASMRGCIRTSIPSATTTAVSGVGARMDGLSKWGLWSSMQACKSMAFKLGRSVEVTWLTSDGRLTGRMFAPGRRKAYRI